MMRFVSIYLFEVFWFFQNPNIGISLKILSLILIANIILALFLSTRKEKIYPTFLIFVLCAGVVFIGLEHYDTNYTYRYQLSDSILNYFGWVNPHYSHDFFSKRVLGVFIIALPLIIMFFELLFVLYYFIVLKKSK